MDSYDAITEHLIHLDSNTFWARSMHCSPAAALPPCYHSWPAAAAAARALLLPLHEGSVEAEGHGEGQLQPGGLGEGAPVQDQQLRGGVGGAVGGRWGGGWEVGCGWGRVCGGG